MTAPSFPDTASPAANLGNPLPYLFNWSPDRMKKWRAARAKARRNSANSKILCLGDSTTRGVGAAAGSAAYLNGWPVQLAGLLTAGGVPAGWQNWFGLGGISIALYPSSDSRLNFGTFTDPGFRSLGGNMPRATSSNTMSFTTTVNCDTFDVYYYRNPGNGIFDINLDGGATLASPNSNGASSMQVQNVSGSLAQHTLNIVWSSGTILPIGINGYSSATKQVSVINAGISSIASTQLLSTSNGYDGLNVIPTLAADLHIISLGINDWRGFVEIAYYRRSMQTLITACKTVGDVILLTPVPSDVTAAAVSVADQQKYINTVYDLAQANDIPLVDCYSRFVDYTTANGLGYMFDTLHPNGVGYSEMAQAVSSALLTAV